MLLANIAITTRAGASSINASSAAPTPAFGAAAHRNVDVGAIAEQQGNASIAELGQARLVRRLTVGRVGIEVEVTRVQHAAHGGLHVQRAGFDDRVRDAHRLDSERTDSILAASVRFTQIELARRELMFQETPLGDLERVRRSPNRQLELGEQVGKRAQMVFVAVGQKDSVQALTLREKPAEVRMPNVDAHVVVGEGSAAIDDHDAAGLLEREAVHADLPQPRGGRFESDRALNLGKIARWEAWLRSSPV